MMHAFNFIEMIYQIHCTHNPTPNLRELIFTHFQTCQLCMFQTAALASHQTRNLRLYQVVLQAGGKQHACCSNVLTFMSDMSDFPNNLQFNNTCNCAIHDKNFF